jgi:isoleucyl-tRNA synthetase
MSTTYKESLNLPKTDFPMKANLVAREPELQKYWDDTDIYGQIQAARAGAPLFLLHDGPPFANGDAHMGTALNKILKDIVVKSRTMAGYRAPYLPGWDCHGLPIEFKVVKETRGLSALEIRQRSEALARKFIDIQRRQFKRLGIFGDWDHPYLTMAPGYEAEILRAFARFVELGLVYQSKKPVYWSTGARTALAEAEVEYHDEDAPAIYVKFPLVSGPLAGHGSIVIWTTTPWTLPANQAVAVNVGFSYRAQTMRHPQTGNVEVLLLANALVDHFCRATGYTPAEPGEDDATFLGGELEGWRAQHPFLDRDVPVILGDFVTLEAGTGCVHIAPGHGNDDFIVGRKYGLPVFSPVDDDGRYTADCGLPQLVGKYVFAANPEIITLLKERGMLAGEGVIHHSYPHCWRSKVPIIFRAVEQFFIRMDQLRPEALRAIDSVQWLPPWGRNRIYGTVESRPDWCISRQRSWGVPLPVFYDAAGEPILDVAWIQKVADLVEQHGTNIWFDPDDTSIAGALALEPGVTRRNDTLDVWIDSGVSHRAVVEKIMGLTVPADLYLEATDQHRGWFQSSLITSVALNGISPYKTCLTHGFVVDADTREKISKSKQPEAAAGETPAGAGTAAAKPKGRDYVKPTLAEHFVNLHGADIVRLWVASVNFTDDVPFGEQMFARLSETYRRLRNTLRILLGNLADFDPATHSVSLVQLSLVDRWIMHRVQEVIATCAEAYEAYEFHRVYHTLNQFCAVDLSSLYVDITKDRMYCDLPDSRRRRATQTVMHHVFDALCRLLAPLCPFTAEEAWSFFDRTTSIHLEFFPGREEAYLDPDAAALVERLLGLRAAIAQAVEQGRQEKIIGNALEAEVTLAIADPAMYTALADLGPELEEFFILSDLKLTPAPAGANTSATLGATSHRKCQRCWRHRAAVGLSALHPDLCDRCEDAVTRQLAAVPV